MAEVVPQSPDRSIWSDPKDPGARAQAVFRVGNVASGLVSNHKPCTYMWGSIVFRDWDFRCLKKMRGPQEALVCN